MEIKQLITKWWKDEKTSRKKFKNNLPEINKKKIYGTLKIILQGKFIGLSAYIKKNQKEHK